LVEEMVVERSMGAMGNFSDPDYPKPKMDVSATRRAVSRFIDAVTVMKEEVDQWKPKRLVKPTLEEAGKVMGQVVELKLELEQRPPESVDDALIQHVTEGVADEWRTVQNESSIGSPTTPILLPIGWNQAYDADELYFYNTDTGEAQRERPAGTVEPLPPAWKAAIDVNRGGRVYFYNDQLGISPYDDPRMDARRNAAGSSEQHARTGRR
jgi:hypothetical protein